MLIAKQENIEVPVYDLMVNRALVGVMTHLPVEKGPLYTVRHGEVEVTGGYSCANVTEALAEARETWAELAAGTHYAQQPEPEWIEDEDGELAYEQMMERRAEEWAMRDEAWGTAEYY
jgi:hypothetical protein